MKGIRIGQVVYDRKDTPGYVTSIWEARENSSSGFSVRWLRKHAELETVDYSSACIGTEIFLKKK